MNNLLKYPTTLWVGTQPNPAERLQLSLGWSDQNAFDKLPNGPSNSTVTVTDRNTGLRYTLRRADCGLHCFCAAELVEEGE